MNQLTYYQELLRQELVQRAEEGGDVTGFAAQVAEIKTVADAEHLYDTLMRLEIHSPYHEPYDLPAIRAARFDGPRRLPVVLSEAQLRDKIYGGWLGRCAGCQLGKPVEGWGRAKIEARLKLADDYPLHDYFSEKVLHPDPNDWEEGLWRLPATRERLDHAARDDDQDYTILDIVMLQAFGRDFTTEQVGQKWLEMLPYHQVYTAERQAYRNLVDGYAFPDSAVRWNPYREWIGAQIRADGWGYVTPGWPEKAAEFAFRDAALSHVKNGIYGEMFMAAAIAAAFVTDDVVNCLQIAAAEIPQASRFSEMVQDCLHWAKTIPDWDTAWEQMQAKYGRYHWVHTLNNAAVVLLALLYGQRDFEKTLVYAVMGGWDTDCNGATAGSLLGVMLGAERLPERWIAPLNDRLQSFILGYGECRISHLAEQTYNLIVR
ncbi:MAG TPA: ADP-ribosylglycohydrolase family protein [Phototrophicaceae bacterium]|nr:ADP-ribosylglycohydrolase family protein [Phototrophicaceae bacterium]